jgi:hypothetical protein
MKASSVFLFYCAIVAVEPFERARYDNYRVFEIVAESDVHLKLLKSFEDHPNGVNFRKNLNLNFTLLKA